MSNSYEIGSGGPVTFTPEGGESPDTSPQPPQIEYPLYYHIIGVDDSKSVLKFADGTPAWPGQVKVNGVIQYGQLVPPKEVAASPGPASPGGFGNSDLNLWVIGVLEAQLARDRDSLEVLERHLQQPLLGEVQKTVHTNIERANTAISILRKQL